MRISAHMPPVVLLLFLLACQNNKLGVSHVRDAAVLASPTDTNASGAEPVASEAAEDPAKLVPSAISLPAFGPVPLGSSSAAQSFAITNMGQAASSAISLNSDDNEFSIQSNVAGSCTSGMTTLAGGASCTVNIVFTPTGAGYRAATLTFTALSGGKGSVGVTGTAPVVQGTLAIFAGFPSGEGSANGTGANAHFSSPTCLAADKAGNVFVAGTNSIRKITPDGVVTTFAGTEGLSDSTAGTGADARFTSLKGVAVDTLGNVFVSDNNTIRKITAASGVTTLAGKAGTEGTTNGTGTAARFVSPAGLAVDPSGNIFVADDNAIRKITPAGVVTTFAGTAYGSGSADGTGTAASFEWVQGVAVDASGNVFVADTNNEEIRKITPAGVVTTLAGAGSSSFGYADGSGAAASFEQPTGVAVDPSGNVFVADYENNTIRKISPAGVVTTFAGTAGWSGSADGTRAEAHFHWPQGVAVDGAGNVFVADSGNNAIRKITPAGVVTTLAGSAFMGGNGTAATFSSPAGAAVDSAGNVFIADSGDRTIRKITPAGVVTTFAGTSRAIGNADGTGAAARFNAPQGLAVDRVDNIFVADFGNNEIRKITPAGVVTTLAGVEGSPGSADGTGAVARFNGPQGIAVDRAGNVFVTDNGNNTIRKITAAGVVTTLAGLAGVSGIADGTGADARFNGPQGIAVDLAGNVFVADFQYNTIRKITSSGIVTTLAGAADANGDSVDGTGAAARFHVPEGLAVDGAGNVLVADTFNHTIRRITPNGVVSTVVGTAAPVILGNIPGPLPASIVYPYWVAVDPSTGSIYITLNSAVMVATFAGSETSTGGNAGSGGMVGAGGIVGTGGAPSSGGSGGAGGAAGSSDVFGMPCTNNQDCPSNARCCDGSDPSCDGTRLPSGDGANPGELVVSSDALTVTDTITGLVWQRDGSGARSGCSGNGNLTCSWAEADAYCTSLVLGGVSGWRLPAWMELRTILDLSDNAVAIDQTAFPATPTWSSYWTSSLYSYWSNPAMYVSFVDGSSGLCNEQVNVRCVRGSRCYPSSRFGVLDGGLVRDALTGLVWQQQESASTMTWADAQSYCLSLVSGGSGFRLPTLKELDSIMDLTADSGPTLDRTAFPYTGTDTFWTSSPYVDRNAASSGDMRYDDNGLLSCDLPSQNWTTVDQKLKVRCVR